jgi:hypothetical protein
VVDPGVSAASRNAFVRPTKAKRREKTLFGGLLQSETAIETERVFQTKTVKGESFRKEERVFGQRRAMAKTVRQKEGIWLRQTFSN